MRGSTASTAIVLLAVWTNAPEVAAQKALAAPSPVTLENYVATHGIDDQAGVQFLTLRCAALYLLSSNWLSDESPGVAAQFKVAGKQFLAVASSTAKGQEEFIRDQVGRMTQMYSDRARAAKANTGSVFDDPLLRSDMFFCKKLAK